ncbi:aldose 1-epimerase [Spirochaeta thermophila]|uniref:Putative aldose-epimerase n=1 Tax=Winmispira thermophila (strain ATCC 49972 / DSM 6192 / RI 19.B1) TaxID=665571 RepID=E0RNW0_WINT6|nr:aldose 1-epimerase [Spirochaeta thermophila]ADN01233.1 putative aldose-epimerase [Spirochaeta thermophila DSM 6192]
MKRFSLDCGVEVVRLEGERCAVEVIPGLGGIVRQMWWVFGGEPHRLLVEDAPEELLANPWFRGRLLFPFNDRIPGGVYCFEGREYAFPCTEGDDALHGFLWQRPMRVRRGGETREGEWLECEYVTDGSDRGYPFEVGLRVRYEVGGDGFSLRAHVWNAGGVAAPVSIGWHPYVSPGAGMQVDDLVLRIPAEAVLEVDERLLPTGRILPVGGTPWDFRAGRRLGSTPCDMGFFLFGKERMIAVSADRYRLIMRLGGIFSYVQVFVPPQRDGVAVEPVASLTDGFNHPEWGAPVLKPGEHRWGEVWIRAER